ncbi:uncharacterized protein LOC126839025 isoform X2 [Adelges cooleyi]|uniref:uncharacterized protein LOC126839025 isoform X2 n=1 Tax=Adelges cooleyi TaxID=133065 RepID=UPI00218014E7|nr:uncharacterized protein LOC126839025 isoform X2 [Adelges cooleyi]
MFSKNIILLVCVVSFIVKSITAYGGEIPAGTVETASSGEIPAGTVETVTSVIVDDGSTSTGNINLDEITDDQWKSIFIKHDTDKSGSISSKELQKLVFDEFNGFLPVGHADIYIHLLKSNDKNELELEQLPKIKPILFFLTKTKGFLDTKVTNKNITYSGKSIVNGLKKTEIVKALFLNENDISEILDLFGLNVTSRIEWMKCEQIVNMVGGCISMALFHVSFDKLVKDQAGGIDVNNLLETAVLNVPGKSLEETVIEESDDPEADDPDAEIKETLIQSITNRDLDRHGSIDFYEYMVIMRYDFKLFGEPEMYPHV